MRVHNGVVSTRPIAGTRPRGEVDVEDMALEAEMLVDEKEIAEHVMLVDLGRNDVGRVAEPGTVRVERLAHVERFSHLMHLVSHVDGQLLQGRRVRRTLSGGHVDGSAKSTRHGNHR